MRFDKNMCENIGIILEESRKIEALLFAAKTPLPKSALAAVLEKSEHLDACLEQLNKF